MKNTSKRVKEYQFGNFNKMMGNPMEQIGNLVKEAKKIGREHAKEKK